MTPQLFEEFRELVEKIDNKYFYVVMGGIAADGYTGKIDNVTTNKPIKNLIDEIELLINK